MCYCPLYKYLCIRKCCCFDKNMSRNINIFTLENDISSLLMKIPEPYVACTAAVAACTVAIYLAAFYEVAIAINYAVAVNFFAAINAWCWTYVLCQH